MATWLYVLLLHLFCCSCLSGASSNNDSDCEMENDGYHNGDEGIMGIASKTGENCYSCLFTKEW